MAKYVKYNGQIWYFAGCKSELLIKGRIYKVTHERFERYHLDNTGSYFECFDWFPSFLFEEVDPIKAISNVIPEEYGTLRCTTVNWIDGIPRFKEVNVSYPRMVNPIGENLYEVITTENVYIIFVI